jgi:glycine amidinotransferase
MIAPALPVPPQNKATPVVNSYDEWSLLEEVIVGVIEGAAVPAWHVTLEATMPSEQRPFFEELAGRPFPKERMDAAARELDAFAHILEAEGVTVRRPTAVNFARPYATPDWQSPGGLYAAMPRDLLLVIGDEIIEAPMAWRSRYYEVNAYRPLLHEYFHRGGRWTAAPKPQLNDDLYNSDYREPAGSTVETYAITEYEPTFDAADFVRFGRDVFVQKSHVTNDFGINWLRRHLGEDYTIHVLPVTDSHPMHIDATLMPLAPGKALVNAERIGKLPDMFKSWEILPAPRPALPDTHPMYMSSTWVSMNILMLDEERVVVEAQEEPLIRAFKEWGFKPVLCDFRNFNSFGGSFHCATLDVRRAGGLTSYF